jgi:hypothetical protein
MHDFLEPRGECQPHADPSMVEQLNQLPKVPGDSRCMHLVGDARICIVGAVLGTSLFDNPEVRVFWGRGETREQGVIKGPHPSDPRLCEFRFMQCTFFAPPGLLKLATHASDRGRRRSALPARELRGHPRHFRGQLRGVACKGGRGRAGALPRGACPAGSGPEGALVHARVLGRAVGRVQARGSGWPGS